MNARPYIFFAAFVSALVLFLGITKKIFVTAATMPLMQFDTAVSMFFFNHRTPWLSEMLYWITTLGNWQTVLCVGLIFSGYLVVAKKYRYLFPFVTVLAGSSATVYLLKIFLGRERPDMEIAYYIEQSLSFPSAHAALSFVLYGYIAYALARICTEKGVKDVTPWLYVTAIVTVLLIGLSRLYLGVHYATDVLGGYLIGVLWFVIALMLTEIVWKR